jgi:para-nitrobenzyl esterase
MADDIFADTANGRIRGQLIEGVATFKGIPYAASTAGAGRFKPPAKPVSWSGVRDAIAFGPRAFQNDNAFAIAPAVMELFQARDLQPMSEDCLVLNVWTKGVADDGDRPVMVWLHGGAFISGSGASPWTEGANLARKGDVVVVTLNHRLGALGYLYLAELGGAEFADSGNAGMLDIVAALGWVRDNIAAFGGDPDNVTVFGESGGGAKISMLMAMPAAQGLFHKAIIQSGPAVETIDAAGATETARQVLAELGVAEPRALLQVPAEKIIAAQSAVLGRLAAMSFANRRRQGFNPVIDGKNLPGGPFAPQAPAISAHVPLMIGTNKDEMNLFFSHAPWGDGLTEAKMPDVARNFLGDRTETILAAYRQARPKASPRDLVLAIMTDQSIRRPSLTIADRKLAQKAAPVFVYLFAWETPVVEGRLGSCHALEIPFVFDNLDASRMIGDSPMSPALADTMSRSWIEFAYKDNPNHSSIPYWPAYSADRPTMLFDVQSRVENDPFGAERKAWDG